MRDETRISLPVKLSLTRTTLGQLCIAPWTSQSLPAATEPGLEPRVSGGTETTAPPGRPTLAILVLLQTVAIDGKLAHSGFLTCVFSRQLADKVDTGQIRVYDEIDKNKIVVTWQLSIDLHVTSIQMKTLNFIGKEHQSHHCALSPSCSLNGMLFQVAMGGPHNIASRDYKFTSTWLFYQQ